jgi:phosphoribosyl-ATP pyrophosphohydrolase/phosphoribosyl-AMP cyclohydrolase/histidinol dehydrogenase
LIEEATELGEPGADIASETADLLYFILARLVASGVSLDNVESILDRRERRLSRRPMAAKEKK